MINHAAIVSALVLLLTGSLLLANPHERWEEDIARFEDRDAENPPEPGGILFAGSSSIVRWDLEKWFEDLDAVNRGFGGSQIADSVHFAPRFLHPHKPDVVVLYAGDNDINAGKSPGTVLEDFQAFVETVRTASPQADVVFVAIKPSTSRWHLVDEIREANALVREQCEDDLRLHYADIFGPTLNDEGEPEEAYLADDGLHLSEAGYEKWTAIVRPILDDILSDKEDASADG